MSETLAQRIRRKQRMADRQGGICPWCTLPLLPEDIVRTQVDHIIPLGRGGPNLRWNRQLLHEKCNYAKGSKLTPEAEKLAAQHGVILYEPLPKAWPGSTKAATGPAGVGKPNPYRALREAGLSITPGGPCLCGRGEAVGTLTHTSGRMHFRAFHDGPALWHHENSVDWACLDCIADIAAAIASGEVREGMRRIATARRPAPPGRPPAVPSPPR